MLKRREFLALLASGVVGSTIDVDRLLWVPNVKKIFLPSITRLTTSQILEVELARIFPHINTLFERDDVFYQAFTTRRGTNISGRAIRVPLRTKDDI